MASRKQLISTLRTGYYANPKKSYGRQQTEMFNAPSIGNSYKYRGDKQAYRQRTAWQAQKNIHYAQRHGLTYVSRRKSKQMLTANQIKNLQSGLNSMGFSDVKVNKDNVGHYGHLWELAQWYDERAGSNLVREMIRYEQLSQGEIEFNTISDVHEIFKGKKW